MPDIIQQIRDADEEGNYVRIIRELLPELFQAADWGGVIELPCKVGDKVWTNWCGYPKEYIVVDIYICEYFVRYKVQTGATFEPKDVGRTVFLTRESAEKALKERES